MYYRTIIYLFLIVSYIGCKSTYPLNNKSYFKTEIQDIIYNDPIFNRSLTGLFVKKINTSDTIIDIRSGQYFTPASNTKLLTFYTSLNILSDKVVGIKKYENADSIIIWGTGDPSFLNPNLHKNDFILSSLNETDKPVYLYQNPSINRYGSGWSWDDYSYYFQPEISAFPMYGNVVEFKKEDNKNTTISPLFFEKLFFPSMDSNSPTILRKEHENVFVYNPEKLNKKEDYYRQIPYITTSALNLKLLREVLGKEAYLTNNNAHFVEAINIESVAADSLYQLLLQDSDNFVAEQLLVNCSYNKFGTIQSREIIEWSKENLLKDMPYPFQWVDGSGLSRYNMTTPANMVHVLEKIYAKVPQDRLFRLLPAGGESGTIKNWYGSEKPYIHAKTGSLSNNHCLSGYLNGDSGAVYVFSFMNSNFLTKTTELKKGMERVLKLLKANL